MTPKHTLRLRYTHSGFDGKQQSMPRKVLIHKRWSKYIKEVQHSGPRITRVSIEKRIGDDDEHVHQVYSEFQKHTDECRMTNTHMLIGGDLYAQVGANDEQDATNDEHKHSVDSEYVGSHAFGTQNSRGQRPQEALGSPVFCGHWQTRSSKKEETEATHHSTKRCKQIDSVLLNRALSKHCKEAEATEQIDMNSDYKPVTARIELPIDHKTQQIKQTSKRKTEKQ